MEHKYLVSLTNKSGATFDTERFETLAECREWAKGRGKTFDFGEWNDYTVRIYEIGNLDPIEEYKER